MGLTIAIVAVSLVFSLGIAIVVLKQAGVMGPRKRVLASGEQGRATIIGVAPTGTVINEINYVCKFQLRVTVPGRATYDVETKESVPITAMGAIVPGTTVGVRVDPKDPTSVFIDWSAGVAAAGTPTSAQPTPSTGELATALHDPAAAATIQQGSAADLLRTGQPAVGLLKSFADTGNTPRSLGNSIAPEAMDDPLYVLTVDLQFAPGTPPIEGTVVHRVPRAIAPTLRIGMPLTCAVDPGNPTRRFAINWAAAATRPQSASAPSQSHN